MTDSAEGGLCESSQSMSTLRNNHLQNYVHNSEYKL